MKIVVFKSGLGNQIFVYLLCLYLKDKGYRVYSYSTKEWLKSHNGLEISKWFDLVMPPRTLWTDIIALVIRSAKKLFPELIAMDSEFKENAIYFDGYWQDAKFFNNNISKIKFGKLVLSNRNKKLIAELKGKYAVSIHIRRGDYMEASRIKSYSQSCPAEYYNNAINYVHQKVNNPFFLLFSDDMAWVKENIISVKSYNHIYIDWNTGQNSFYDMYIMSHCRASIIANSSFSYWGAMLGEKKDFVIRPKKWIGDWVPNIFPDEWIILDGK